MPGRCRLLAAAEGGAIMRTGNYMRAQAWACTRNVTQAHSDEKRRRRRYRGGTGFLTSECTSCQFSHTHTRACLSGALAMLLLGRAIHARPFCEKSASAHFKMSPLSRANWQNFFRVARGRLAGKGGLRTAARRRGPKKTTSAAHQMLRYGMAARAAHAALFNQSAF